VKMGFERRASRENKVRQFREGVMEDCRVVGYIFIEERELFFLEENYLRMRCKLLMDGGGRKCAYRDAEIGYHCWVISEKKVEKTGDDGNRGEVVTHESQNPGEGEVREIGGAGAKERQSGPCAQIGIRNAHSSTVCVRSESTFPKIRCTSLR
jgi:hypothetical protein